MQEGAIMEVIKWFIALFLLMMLVSFSIFVIDMSTSNNYKQYVNYEIERNGGLTAEALNNLEAYSDEHFKGMYTVSSDRAMERVEFGESVDYTVHGSYSIFMLPTLDIDMDFGGSAVSYIR